VFPFTHLFLIVGESEIKSILTIIATTGYGNMKFNFFGKKSKCPKCGKKFRNETELAEHEHIAHRNSA
jgi:hypothetical protein